MRKRFAVVVLVGGLIGIPWIARVGEILECIPAIQNALIGQLMENGIYNLYQSAFQGSTSCGCDKILPLSKTPLPALMHDVDDETLDIYESAAGASSDVSELF